MARGDTVLRQWNLLVTLQSRGQGIPLRDLAEQCEVSERTIQRDFEVLQELGFPIEHDEDEFGKRFWRLPYDFFKTGPLVLGLTEAVSLHLAERLFTPLAGTHFAEGLGTILDKIRSLVPREALEYFAGLDETVYVRRIGQPDYAAHAETIRALVDGALTERAVELVYRSLWRGDEYATLCDPYGLVYYDGDLFLVGRSHRADAIRMFKVTRIIRATSTPEAFQRPDDFSLERHFRDSFGITHSSREPVDIQVRFTGPAAALVRERVWHESQQLELPPAEESLFDEAVDQPDTVIATFRLADVIEFKRWLMGFGERAEVLAPMWLREELGTELRAAASQYQGEQTERRD